MCPRSFLCSLLLGECKAHDPQILDGLWEIGNTMATRKQKSAFLPPQTPLTLSPTLSAICSLPLSGTLPSYPVASSPFSSLSSLSHINHESTPSLDLFDALEYTKDIDADFCRIDMDAAESQCSEVGHSSPSITGTSIPSTLSLTPVHDQKTWVVFHGKVPGIYNDR